MQRLLLTPQKMAREFRESDLSAHFKGNGSTDPADVEYKALAEKNFSTYSLKIGGLVENPFRDFARRSPRPDRAHTDNAP